jgi:hypothetical protein
MAPEQLLGDTADVRSDLFALGVLVYEMLTGRLPFKADEEGGKALIRQIQSGRYPRIRGLARGVPGGFARLIDRCLNAKPRKRPVSATDLREGLEAVFGAVPPGECRAEIASWMWGAGVFHVDDNATVALPQQSRTRKRRRGRVPTGWFAAAAAGLGLVVGAASLNLLALRSVDVSETVSRGVDTLVTAREPAPPKGS